MGGVGVAGLVFHSQLLDAVIDLVADHPWLFDKLLDGMASQPWLWDIFLDTMAFDPGAFDHLLDEMAAHGATLVGDAALVTASRNVRGMATVVYQHIMSDRDAALDS